MLIIFFYLLVMVELVAIQMGEVLAMAIRLVKKSNGVYQLLVA